jgi:hypothetical protein
MQRHKVQNDLKYAADRRHQNSHQKGKSCPTSLSDVPSDSPDLPTHVFVSSGTIPDMIGDPHARHSIDGVIRREVVVILSQSGVSYCRSVILPQPRPKQQPTDPHHGDDRDDTEEEVIVPGRIAAQ